MISICENAKKEKQDAERWRINEATKRKARWRINNTLERRAARRLQLQRKQARQKVKVQSIPKTMIKTLKHSVGVIRIGNRKGEIMEGEVIIVAKIDGGEFREIKGSSRSSVLIRNSFGFRSF